MNLTEHFTLDELTLSNKAVQLNIDNTPPPEMLPRLVMVAEMLERIRSTLGCPVIVTSGYRCPELNVAVGSATTSDHPQGHAADFVAPDFGSAMEIARKLAPLVSTLGIGQIILEQVTNDGVVKKWVHVSTHQPEKPINRVITITDAGIVPGIVGLA